MRNVRFFFCSTSACAGRGAGQSWARGPVPQPPRGSPGPAFPRHPCTHRAHPAPPYPPAPEAAAAERPNSSRPRMASDGPGTVARTQSTHHLVSSPERTAPSTPARLSRGRPRAPPPAVRAQALPLSGWRSASSAGRRVERRLRRLKGPPWFFGALTTGARAGPAAPCLGHVRHIVAPFQTSYSCNAIAA